MVHPVSPVQTGADAAAWRGPPRPGGARKP